jgi:sortase A
MRNLGSTQAAGSGLTAQVLIWVGALLLLVGGLLAYPYFGSRMATFPPTPTVTSSLPPPAVPSPTATDVPPTGRPTLAPDLTHTPPPTPTPTHAPTPTPALPTRIVIPSIGVDAPVFPVSWRTIEVDGQEQVAWEVLDMYAAGWHETSAPLGVPGNVVFNGHNTTNGEIFRDLYTLETGDHIVVYSDDTPYTYAVSEVLILPEAGQPLEVRVENAQYALPTEDERLTLITCHPYGSLRYRLIVIARPMATLEGGEG